MNRVLVLYGTTDGHTRKIAGAIATTLQAEGAAVDTVDASVKSRAPAPNAYAGVVVAASVHIGGYQRSVRNWIRSHAGGLGKTPHAFVSVCLGVLEHRPETDRELQAILERFFESSGWRPSIVKIVAGATPYTRYPWWKKWIIRRMVKKQGGGTDTSRDYEYTDWDELASFTRGFYRTITTGRAADAPRRN